MSKLEICFTARIPYDADEPSRNTTIEFTTENLDEVVRQMNKFLVLNDYDAQVALV